MNSLRRQRQLTPWFKADFRYRVDTEQSRITPIQTRIKSKNPALVAENDSGSD